MLRNQLYAGIVDVPEYGVRNKRGDFEPLISEDLFQRAQAVLSGRIPTTAPRLQAHPDFPLRSFVRCATCNRGFTGGWSKGRSDYYAYYHCRPGCRGVNVTKAKLETLFVDELARLQPTAGNSRWRGSPSTPRSSMNSDVEGILAFAERVLPRAADLWVQAPLEQRQRFQQLFFPKGMTFDGQRFVGIATTAPAFSYLREIRPAGDGVVDLTGIGQC